jgi:hypothetical protein
VLRTGTSVVRRAGVIQPQSPPIVSDSVDPQLVGLQVRLVLVDFDAWATRCDGRAIKSHAGFQVTCTQVNVVEKPSSVELHADIRSVELRGPQLLLQRP